MPDRPTTTSPAVTFRSHYEKLAELPSQREANTTRDTRVTLSAESQPLIHFLRWVSDEAGVSIVADASLDDRPVSVDVVDVPVSQLLASVARRLGVELTRTGSVFYLGAVRPEDRGVMVRRVVRLDKDQLNAAVSVFLSQDGRVESYADGLVVVGDRVEVLEKIIEVLDRVESAPIDSWVVQLYLVSVNDRWDDEVGVDISQSVEVAAKLAYASGQSMNDASLGVTADLSALLRATLDSEWSKLVAEPMFVLVDGTSSSFRDGQSIPVPRRAVLESGTVTTAGFEYVDAGVEASVGVRDVGAGRALLDVTVELTTLTGFVEDAPIISGERFATAAVLQSGGVYLLGQLANNSQREGRTGGFGFVKTRDDDKGVTQVWARAYRIGGAVTGEDPAQPVGTPGDAHTMPDDRYKRAYEIWKEESPDNPKQLRWLLGEGYN